MPEESVEHVEIEGDIQSQGRMALIASRIARGIDSLDTVGDVFRTITPEEREEVRRTFGSTSIEDLVSDSLTTSSSRGDQEVEAGERVDLEVSEKFLTALQDCVVLRGRIGEHADFLEKEISKTQKELSILSRKKKLLLGLNHKRMVVRFVARVKLNRNANKDIASQVRELNTVEGRSELSSWEKIRGRFGNRIAKKRTMILDIVQSLSKDIEEKQTQIAKTSKELLQRKEESTKLSIEEVGHLRIYRAALSGENPTLSSDDLASVLSSVEREGLPESAIKFSDRYSLPEAVEVGVEVSRVREEFRRVLREDLVETSREGIDDYYDLQRLEVISKLKHGVQISIAREKLEAISKEELKRGVTEIESIKGEIVGLEKEIKVLEKQRSQLDRGNVIRRGIRKVAVTLSKSAREKRVNKILGNLEGHIAAEKKLLKGQGKESSTRLEMFESSRSKLSDIKTVSVWKRLAFGEAGRQARST